FREIMQHCIGAIDRVHVPVTINPNDQILFIGRKGISIQNVIVACNFNMQFTFSWAGWEGSVHDTHIFYANLRRPNINFPSSTSKYYLVDVRYPPKNGYLGPYKEESCHL
ncbi:LOW QUALITY PROTEIN: DDE_4 domain-containing protein, partial [Cephalotus follicularis]